MPMKPRKSRTPTPKGPYLDGLPESFQTLYDNDKENFKKILKFIATVTPEVTQNEDLQKLQKVFDALNLDTARTRARECAAFMDSLPSAYKCPEVLVAYLNRPPEAILPGGLLDALRMYAVNAMNQAVLARGPASSGTIDAEFEDA